MGGSLEARIRKLQEFYWSDADPDGRGFVNLADAYRRVGDRMEALRILRDGLRRHPELGSGYVVRGWVYVEEGDPADAQAAFRAALEVDPHNVSALRGLGDVLAREGEAAEAAVVLKVLLPLDPLDGDLPGRIQELEVSAVAAAAAAAAVEESLSTEEPEEDRPWEDPEGAAEELDWEAAALQADQSKPREVEGLGDESGEAAGDTSPEEALLAPPLIDDALVTKTMGDIFLRQGLLDEAEEVFEKLLVRDPGNPFLEGKLEEVRARQRGEEVVSPLPEASFGESPGTGAPELIVPIQDLASGGIVSIEDLAPDRIVSIDDLAPDVIVPIHALAPDSPPGDPTLDAFDAWLDELP